MRCIYCLDTTNGREGEAHIFPESLMANEEVLPRGAVCDGCNNYLSDLDKTLATHPLISLAIQFRALPGKRKKARAKVGNVDRKVYPYGITIPCMEPQPILDANGKRTGYKVTPLYDRSFDLWKFRRALHHVAFNLVAAMRGIERVYESKFDRARRYVREAQRTDNWPYGQYVISLEHIDPVMLGGLFESDVDEFVGLRLFQVTFFVDLLTENRLGEFLAAQQPPGTELIDANAKLPSQRPEGSRRYRFTIVLDESHPDAL